MTIGERFRLVRETLQSQSGKKFTQKQMGESLCLSRDSLANIENDRNAPTPAVIQLMCDRYNINREWLEHGNGEMQTELSDVAEIEQFFKQILTDDCTEDGMEFRRALIVALAKIPRDKWGSIAEAFRELADAVNGTKKEQ